MKKTILMAAAGAVFAAVADTAEFKMPDGEMIEMKRLPDERRLGLVVCKECGRPGNLRAINVNAPENQREYVCTKCDPYAAPDRRERRSNKHTRVRRPKTTRKERAAACS